jgi:hypothetical protein
VTHIFKVDQSTVGIALDDDVVKLRGFRKTADGADADLEILSGQGRLGAYLSRGDFDVLLLQSSYDVVGGKRTASHAHGIQPQAHGIFTFTEEEYIGNTRNALKVVADIDVEIVADEERGVTAVRGEDCAAEDEILLSLGNGDSDLLNRGGEPSGSGIDAVLDVNRREVGIASDVKSGSDRADPVVGT